MTNNLKENEYAAYQQSYFDCIDGNPTVMLTDQKDSFEEFLLSLTDEQLEYSYAEGKWTLKQLIMHMIDTEAIFTYRALCISRGEKQPLSGFDQDEYVSNTDFSHINKEYLINYFTITRYQTLVVFKGMSGKQLLMIGQVSDYQMSVRAALMMIAGHFQYHINIINERYLADAE